MACFELVLFLPTPFVIICITSVDVFPTVLFTRLLFVLLFAFVAAFVEPFCFARLASDSAAATRLPSRLPFNVDLFVARVTSTTDILANAALPLRAVGTWPLLSFILEGML